MDQTLNEEKSIDYKKSTSNQHMMQACLIIVISMIFIALLRFAKFVAFHTFIEMLTVILAYTMLIVSISTYVKMKNNYFVFIGITYAFIGVFDLFHTMAFEDLGVFVVSGTNVADQLWVAARYMQGITLILSTIVLYKEIKIRTVLYSYIIATMVLLYLILIWRVFPDCYLEGLGHTSFKVYSEYLISIIYFIALAGFYSFRKKLEVRIRNMMLSSMAFMFSAEAVFALISDKNDFGNAVGHILRLLSYYLTYQAIFHVSMARPYKVLESMLSNVKNELEVTNEKLSIEIKERKRVEDVLFKNEDCYNILIKNSRSAIIIHDGKEFIFSNNGSTMLVGLDKSQSLIGRNIFDFVHPDFKEKVKLSIVKMLESRETSISNEMKIHDINGEIKEVEIESTFIIYKGRPAILSVINDISPNKKIEQLKRDVERNVELLNKTLEQNRLIGDFTANVSHELRTPLNIILGSLQVLNQYIKDFSSDEQSVKILNYLNTIKQSSYRLLRLVNNLIDSSIADSGFLKLKLGNYNIISVIEDVVCSVTPYVESKGINLVFDTDIEEKIMACDSDKLERIMLNLLSNAVKFSKDGDSILVSVEEIGYDVVITVKDTGIGIPKDKLNLIFDRFKQVDKTLASNRQGSGIGLYLVKSLVRLHKGTISVRSEFGEGTEFKITIPTGLLPSGDKNSETAVHEQNIEMINIEFSDIHN